MKKNILIVLWAMMLVPLYCTVDFANADKEPHDSQITEIVRRNEKSYTEENLPNTPRPDGAVLLAEQDPEKVAYATEIYNNFIKFDPELFLWTQEGIKYIGWGGYTSTDEQCEYVKNKALEITQNCSTDAEKIRAIAEYVALNVYYDYDYYTHELYPYSELNLTPYTVLVNKTTVCAGYAYACEGLLQSIGIPCVYVSAPDHAWNMAYDGTRWILFDTTWMSSCTYEYGEFRYSSDIYEPCYDFSIDYANSEYNHLIESLPITICDGELQDFPRYSKQIHVTIPDSVTSIGYRAFYGCYELQSVIIRNGVKSIGNIAFANCSSLTSITIPDSVTTIGDAAFDNCYSIEKVYITSLEAWMNISFYNPYSSPLYYGADLYLNGEKLTELIIPDSITTINSYLFRGCTSITSVTVSDSVTTIGEDAFKSCDSLTSVTIPDSVTTIGNYAFDYCISLTSVTIPDSVTTIGNYAFRYCNNIEKVYITSLEAWMNISFSTSDSTPLYYGADLYLNGELLTELIIPDSITTINRYCFSRCTSITSVTIPDSVKTIGIYAFDDCNSLASVTIGDSVTTIGNFAFYSCDSLTSVTIGDSVKTIRGDAFYNCNNIEKVYITSLDSWMNISFSNAGSTPLYYGADLYLNGEKLINLTISSTQESIKNYAFYGCESLKTITISNPTTSIPDSAFKGCNNATIYGYAGSTAETTARSLVLPFVALDEGWQAKLMYTGKCGDNLMWQLYQNGDLVLSFMNSATSDVIYDYTSSSLPTWNTYSTLVRNVVFPKGITRVGDYAFDKLTGIVTVSYSGDEDSWKETVIGTGNLPLEKAYIIYGEAMNVNINYKDVVKTTATVNGKVIPVIINLEAGTVWQELKDNLIYSDYTDVIVYDHDGILIDLDDLLSTGYILHHINKDGSVIEELLISVSGDVTGDSAVNVDDIQNVVAHLAGDDNELNKIAIDKDLNDVLTMQELNKFIATFR